MPWTLSTNIKGPSQLRLGCLDAALSSASTSSWITIFSTPIEVRQVLSFSADLFFSSAANNTGLVTTLSGPAEPAAVLHNLITGESLTTFRNLTASSYDTPLIGTAENGGNAGTLNLRFRSEVNGTAVTVLRGSWWQVPQPPGAAPHRPPPRLPGDQRRPVECLAGAPQRSSGSSSSR